MIDFAFSFHLQFYWFLIIYGFLLFSRRPSIPGWRLETSVLDWTHSEAIQLIEMTVKWLRWWWRWLIVEWKLLTNSYIVPLDDNDFLINRLTTNYLYTVVTSNDFLRVGRQQPSLTLHEARIPQFFALAAELGNPYNDAPAMYINHKLGLSD